MSALSTSTLAIADRVTSDSAKQRTTYAAGPIGVLIEDVAFFASEFPTRWLRARPQSEIGRLLPLFDPLLAAARRVEYFRAWDEAGYIYNARGPENDDIAAVRALADELHRISRCVPEIEFVCRRQAQLLSDELNRSKDAATTACRRVSRKDGALALLFGMAALVWLAALWGRPLSFLVVLQLLLIFSSLLHSWKFRPGEAQVRWRLAEIGWPVR